jgi:urease accessory protein UreF/urease accessory protein UreE
MLVVRSILGRREEPRFARRRVERLPVAWHEASKRRLRRVTDGGSDVAVDLPRGTFLPDGAVLADDGRRVIVAERRREPALVIRFDPDAPPQLLAEQALRLGHAFGNQHVPVEVEGAEVRVPLTTSERVARATVAALALDSVRVEVAPVALGCDAPLAVGHAHAAATAEAQGRPDRHAGALAALQLGDSALPIGRFVHSHGVEAWLRAHGEAGEDDLRALVESAVRESLGPLDGAVVALAHRATSSERLEQLDAGLTARKIAPPARAASQACGRRLAALSPELTRDPLVDRLAASVRARRTDGNVAVVEGALARALGVPERDAVLLELRGVAAGLLSAAVRLGRLSPSRAQVALLGLAPAIELAADDALDRDVDELRSNAFELEVHALAHHRADARFFST